MRRVVITGLGPIVADRFGEEVFFDSLLEKRCPAQPIPPEFEQHYTYKTRFYVPPPELPTRDRNIEEMSQIALACTALALEDAGIATLENSGVLLGVGMGSLSTGFTSYRAHAAGEGRFNRLVIPMLMPNAPAAWVALKYGADLFAHSVNAACSSGTVAVGEAYQKIARGECERILTGGVDCLTDPHGAILRGFDSLRALTTAEDGLPRPFSCGRSGFLFNMGAGCALVLEELSVARRRGAEIYAEITGYTCRTAAASIVQMPGTHKPLLPLFDIVGGRKVDYFNAHGTGTEQNDRLERDLIRELWGDAQPFISSTKGILGHSIGASGALEAAVAALAIRRGAVHGNLTADVLEGLDCPLDSRELAVETALSASYGFGGHNALLMLERCRS